eukprot:scaffold3046_cov105-Cylindrotheca_fusiformis.AAC.1
MVVVTIGRQSNNITEYSPNGNGEVARVIGNGNLRSGMRPRVFFDSRREKRMTSPGVFVVVFIGRTTKPGRGDVLLV